MIAHDAETRWPASGTDTTTGTRSFTHTPSGVVKGVVLVICADNTISAPVTLTGVTYGGIPMRYRTGAVRLSPSGRVDMWTLMQRAIPQGAQTVQMTGATASAKFAVCSTVIATIEPETTFAGQVGANNAGSANPSGNVVADQAALLYGIIWSALDDPSSLTPGSNYTEQFNVDFGSSSGKAQRSTGILGPGTVAFDFTASSDAWGLVAVALAERHQRSPAIVLQDPGLI